MAKRLVWVGPLICVFAGIVACGSAEDTATPRKVGDTTIPLKVKETEASASLKLARSASADLDLPKDYKTICDRVGGQITWEMSPSVVAGVSFTNSSDCTAKIATSGTYNSDFKVVASFVVSSSETLTYTVNFKMGKCEDGVAELAPFADGTPQCRENYVKTICADHHVLVAYAHASESDSKILLSGTSASFEIGKNCAANASNEIALHSFDVSSPWVTKGVMAIAGRSATVNFEFCLSPKFPTRMFIKPVPTWTNATAFSALYKFAAYVVDTNARSGNATVSVTNAGPKYGEAVCGTGFEDSGYTSVVQ